MLPTLRSIKLVSQAEIHVAGGVTAIVGPNNSGKTLLLNELVQCLTTGPRRDSLVVSDVDLEWRGNADGIVDWIGERFPWRDPGTYPQGYINERSALLSNGSVITESGVRQSRGRANPLGVLAPLYVHHFNAQNRLEMQMDGGAYNPFVQAPSEPIQHLFANRTLSSKLSAAMERAFGEQLTVNRYAGNQITLHVGSVEAAETAPPPTEQYMTEIASLPRLSAQGDGVRAFLGILLTITTGSYSLIVIDEPEAFLHPPQARLLGSVLAELHARDTQVVVATHSEDIVKGITSATGRDAVDTTIVRLTRNRQVNYVAQVPTEEIRTLYQDPLLRYSSVLGGLFYAAVLVCESESDCTYYRAVLDHLVESAEGGDGSPYVDVQLTHCGGKARVAKAVRALRSARVPVVSIVDFDILQNDNEFFNLLDAHGGERAAVEKLRNSIVSSINTKNRRIRRASARAEIMRILDSNKLEELTTNEVNKIKEEVSGSSGWKEAKRLGSGCLTGGTLQEFDSLNAQLRQLGIFIVPVGELEMFHRSTPSGDKASWLRDVLEGQLYKESTPAHEFMRAVINTVQRLQIIT